MTEVGMFGAGRIGKIHAGNLVRQPGAHLKYVVDPDAAAAAALSAQHGAAETQTDAVFADPTVRVVVIASSTDTHADLIERAAAAGKAIFCEKPVDLSLNRARRCADAVKRAGVHCLIGFQRRYDPTFALVRPGRAVHLCPEQPLLGQAAQPLPGGREHHCDFLKGRFLLG